jgi:hypothetical protein
MGLIFLLLQYLCCHIYIYMCVCVCVCVCVCMCVWKLGSVQMCDLSSKQFHYHNRVHTVQSTPRTGLLSGNYLINWDIRTHICGTSVHLSWDFQVSSLVRFTTELRVSLVYEYCMTFFLTLVNKCLLLCIIVYSTVIIKYLQRNA